jgi:hypothetical protein
MLNFLNQKDHAPHISSKLWRLKTLKSPSIKLEIMT